MNSQSTEDFQGNETTLYDAIMIDTCHYCMCVLVTQSWLFVTPWTVAHQATLFQGFSRQEYGSRLPFSSPGDLPDPGIEPATPALYADFLSFVQTCQECTTKMEASCKLWTVGDSWCGFISCNYCTTWSGGDADGAGGCACLGARSVCKLYFLLNFAVNLKLLRNKVC